MKEVIIGEYYRKIKAWQERNKDKVRLYRTLNNIKQRCNNPNDSKYKYYGGKGIKCRITLQDLKTLWTRDKAQELKQPSIHRKDSNKDYSLDNCQFIEMELNRHPLFERRLNMEIIKELRCPKCNKKAGRTTRTGRICINCGYKSNLEDFIVKKD